MRKMKVENLIALLKKSGIILYKHGDDIAVSGNGPKPSKDHPIWKLVKIHIDDICKHFGVTPM